MTLPPLYEFLNRISEKCAHRRVSGDIVLRKVYGTCAEMLQDRGFCLKYTAATTDELLKSIERARPVMTAATDACKAFVYFDKEERTSVKFVRTLLEAHNNDLLIIASVDGPTPFCRKEVSDSILCNFFTFKELTYNVSRHCLVPTHRLVPADEADEKMRLIYSALPEQLPVLLMEDPIRRYYNFTPGSLIEIKRTGIAQEECLYYRRVNGERT